LSGKELGEFAPDFSNPRQRAGPSGKVVMFGSQSPDASGKLVLG